MVEEKDNGIWTNRVAVQKAFDAAVQENKLRVAGNPRIEAKDAGDASQLSFSATFEVYPEVKLGDVAAAKIARQNALLGKTEERAAEWAPPPGVPFGASRRPPAAASPPGPGRGRGRCPASTAGSTPACRC